jgi:hypothetical protein
MRLIKGRPFCHFHPARRTFTRAFAFLLFSFALGHSAQAALIYDTFTDPNNTALIGRFPAPDNTPGVAYAGNGNVSLVGGPTGGAPYEADIQGNVARVGSDAGLGLNLGINSPTYFELTISFNISASTVTQAEDPHRGAGLGFFSSVALGSGGSSHGFNNFTGLVVDRAGTVRLIIGGANSGIATTVAGFDPNVFHTLSYSVDTIAGSGLIYNVLLDGVNVTLTAPANTFTVARTDLAGFYYSDLNAGVVASFDNFSVTVVPEPSAFMGVIVLLFLMGAGKAARSWRARLRSDAGALERGA